MTTCVNNNRSSIFMLNFVNNNSNMHKQYRANPKVQKKLLQLNTYRPQIRCHLHIATVELGPELTKLASIDQLYIVYHYISRKKVCFLLPILPQGGAEFAILHSINAL